MRFCTYCGKEIADEAVICLSCGCKTQRQKPFAYSQPTVEPTQTIIEDSESQLAMWSKITGIISFFIGWFALGITAIVLANLSKEETGGTMSPSAKVGYVCGIVSTILTSVLFVVLIAFITYLSL
jgi:uncharacterized membrane protein YvbJ